MIKPPRNLDRHDQKPCFSSGFPRWCKICSINRSKENDNHADDDDGNVAADHEDNNTDVIMNNDNDLQSRMIRLTEEIWQVESIETMLH